MSAECIVLDSLEGLARATSEGNRQVLEKLCKECVQFLYEQGVPRDRIAAIATPAIFEAFNKYLADYAERGWAAIERDIRGGLPH